MNSVLEHALSYAALGFPVFPLHPCSKVPAIARGHTGGSTNSCNINTWFRDAADLNVGIVLGPATATLVVDVDPRNGGDESFAKLAKVIDLPLTPTCLTGGGGQHLYYRVPLQFLDKIKNITNMFDYPGIDIKFNGYVVAPPSVHGSGVQYRWMERRGLGEIAIADAPDALLELICAPKAPSSKASTPKPNNGPHADGFIPEGARNDTLFRKACSLRGKGLEETAIRGAVLELNKENCSPPLEVDEVLRIVESALRYDPRSEYHLTDLGNAKRLVHALDGEGSFVPKFKTWHVWAGSHWAPDEDGEILRRAKACALKMLDDAKMIANPDLRKACVEWARSSQSKAKLLAMVDLAQSELGIPIAVGNLDTHRHLLNVQNGTIDLRTGKLLPHDRNHRITRVIPMNYNPDAACPTWERLNQDVADGKDGLPQFLHRVAGYCATGEISEQCFFILYGSGANGKSTWLNGVRHALGPYAMQTPTETLLTKWGGSGIPNDVARLRGARFVTASEIEDGRTMNQSLVKEMTGGEPLSARFLYGEFFEFIAEFKLLIGTNHRPKVNGADPAIFRRIRQVPFTLVVPPERQDRELNRKLADEAEGILAWIVRGAVDWYANGLRPPACVTDATEDYRREMDHVGQFIDDCCQPSEGVVRASDLFRAYKAWTSGQGVEAMSQNSFGRELGKRGYLSEKRSGVAYRCGLTLVPDPEVFCRP